MRTIDGVLGYRDQHFWTNDGDDITGSIHVQVAEDVDQQHVLAQIQQLWRERGVTSLTIQIEKDTALFVPAHATSVLLGADSDSTFA